MSQQICARVAIRYIAVLALLFAPLLSGGALANEEGDLTYVAPNDLSKTYMEQLFGQVINITLGGEGPEAPDSIIGAASEVLNAGMMVFVYLVISWVGINGLVNTAGDGQTFGRSYSTTWVPFRVVGSLGLIFPLAGGYSAMQVIILYFAMQGVGLANSVWDAASSFMTTNQTFFTVDAAQHSDELAGNLLAYQVCRAGINAAEGEEGKKEVISSKPIIEDPGIIGDLKAFFLPDGDESQFGKAGIEFNGPQEGWIPGIRNSVKEVFGESSLPLYGPRACGAVEFEIALTDGNSQYDEAAERYFGRLIRGLWALNINIENIAVSAINIDNGHPSTMDPDQLPIVYREVVDQYRSHIKASQRSLQEDLKKVGAKYGQLGVSDPKNNGWIGAGIYYNEFGRMTTRYLNIAGIGPSFTPINSELAEHPDYEEIRKVAVEVTAAARSHSNSGDASQSSVKSDDPDSLRAWVIGSWISGLTIAEEAPMPMAALSAWARYALDIGTTAYLAIKAASAKAWIAHEIAKAAPPLASTVGVAVTSPFVAIFSGAVGWFSAIAILALPSLALLAYYIPMVPYFMWVLAVVGWYVMLTESVIAGPIWAVTHAMPDGVGPVAERAKAGYMILLSVFLRPTLMLFGLLAAILIMQLAAKFVMITFVPAMTDVMGASWSSLLQFLIFALLLVVLLIQVSHRVFGLIHEIPDKVLRYIGNANEVLGEAEQERGVRGIFVAGGQKMTDKVDPSRRQGRAPAPQKEEKDKEERPKE